MPQFPIEEVHGCTSSCNKLFNIYMLDIMYFYNKKTLSSFLWNFILILTGKCNSYSQKEFIFLQESGLLCGCSAFRMAQRRTSRKPILFFLLSGLLLFRYVERRFLPLLFQLPPRNTRLSPETAPLFIY